MTLIEIATRIDKSSSNEAPVDRYRVAENFGFELNHGFQLMIQAEPISSTTLLQNPKNCLRHAW